MIKMFTNLKKVCAAIVVSLFLLQGGALAAGDWFVTKEGPKIWNANPQPNETASWSGAADAQGYAAGKGVLKWFVDGKIEQTYEGMMLRGKFNGKGILTYANGVRYDGDFVDDNYNGKGILTYPNGVRYDGDFVDGKENGQGVLTVPNGNRFEGDFADGKFKGKVVLTYPDGRHYEGDYADGKFNGQGVLTYPNGERLEGIFENGKLIKRLS